jgi:hypothetical protein
MSSTTRSRIVATGLACALVLAPTAGAHPAGPEAPEAPATTMRDAADSLVGTAPNAGTFQAVPAAPAETSSPVVVRTVDSGVDVGSAALGAGGAAMVLLLSGAALTAVRRGRVHHGLS